MGPLNGQSYNYIGHAPEHKNIALTFVTELCCGSSQSILAKMPMTVIKVWSAFDEEACGRDFAQKLSQANQKRKSDRLSETARSDLFAVCLWHRTQA